MIIILFLLFVVIC